MFRPVSRSILRSAQSSLAPGRTAPARRFLSTDPPHLKSRSWKSSAGRWGIAIAGIYFYNTSSVFADAPNTNLLNPNVEALEDSSLPTLDSISKSKKPKNPPSALEKTFAATSSEKASTTTTSSSTMATSTDLSTSPLDLEEEASQEGAFNPVTGEINWDCPCLGGMAHGPCGDEFKAAFSCFVFSEQEPKGMECIDKFQGMQNCFREHPEVYKGELMDDDDEEGELDEALAGERAVLEKEVKKRRAAAEDKEKAPVAKTTGKRLLEESSPPPKEPKANSIPKKQPTPAPSSSEPHPGMSEEHDHIIKQSMQQDPKVAKFDKDLELMPKAWHDSRDLSSTPRKTEQ